MLFRKLRQFVNTALRLARSQRLLNWYVESWAVKRRHLRMGEVKWV